VVDQHQRPASPDERAALAIPAPTHAERCRTLVRQARSATLCTIAREPEGFPYGSLVTIATDAAGRPLLLLSTLAEHTRNLHAQSAASVLLTEPLDAHDQPLAVGRVTILGACTIVPDDEKAAVRETFLAQQPSSSYYVDFKDFAFYRLEPSSLRYVGGFGRMSWVTAEDYRVAEPDPLTESAAGILTHMNDDHGDSVLAYAHQLAGVADARHDDRGRSLRLRARDPHARGTARGAPRVRCAGHHDRRGAPRDGGAGEASARDGMTVAHGPRAKLAKRAHAIGSISR